MDDTSLLRRVEHSAFHYQHLGYSSVSECLRLRLRVCVAWRMVRKVIDNETLLRFYCVGLAPHLAYCIRGFLLCAAYCNFRFRWLFLLALLTYAREPCTLLRWQLLYTLYLGVN